MVLDQTFRGELMLNALLTSLLARDRSSEEGATTVEYAIMLMLIAVSVSSFGLGISGAITSVFSLMLNVLASAT